MRIRLDKAMVAGSSELADFSGLVDEQDMVPDPPKGEPKRGWDIPSQHWKRFPYAATIDLGRPRNLSSLWLFDTHGIGPLEISASEPGSWQVVATATTDQYMRWARVPLDVTARRLRLEFKTPGAMVTEIALYEYTPEAHQAMLDRKAAEARRRAERETAIRRAQEELPKRPWVELPPFGRLRVVDDVDCAAPDPSHQFRESPAGASRVETILGRPCRVLRPVEGESSYMAFRLGKWKLL
ncbi:MAG: hypothetical protein NUV77_12100, partial [Thermoguttaceae bacterium]|nr:hypothetical protein [Thermoguttaceae bacterium]